MKEFDRKKCRSAPRSKILIIKIGDLTGYENLCFECILCFNNAKITINNSDSILNVNNCFSSDLTCRQQISTVRSIVSL